MTAGYWWPYFITLVDYRSFAASALTEIKSMLGTLPFYERYSKITVKPTCLELRLQAPTATRCLLSLPQRVRE